MVKKKKVIKRYYEKGEEVTLFSKSKRKRAARPARGMKVYGKRRLRRAPIKDRLTPGTLRSKVYLAEKYELPLESDKTRLTLMAKDPFSIFAYWQIGKDFQDKLERAYGAFEREKPNVVLRMYDVTNIDFNGRNANHYFDIDVGPHANNWYVNLWRDNVSYVGELGFRDTEGEFVAVTRSNFVHTPRKSFSPRTDEIWMRVAEEGPKPPYVVAKPVIDTSRRAALERREKPPHIKERVIHLREDDVRKYYSQISPLLRKIISDRLQPYSEETAPEVARKTEDYKFVLESEQRDRDRDRSFFSFLPKEEIIKRIMLGSSQELLFPGASEVNIPGLGGASDIIHEKIIERKFFFELNTELIVYGRTEPDAKVWLKDKNIPLRSDGTFSLRLSLPDGKLPLEFKAVSSDNIQSKSIHTYVERSTIRKD